MRNVMLALLWGLLVTAPIAHSKEIHQHASKDIGASTPVPKIEIHVMKDMVDGVNVHLAVSNYHLNAPYGAALDSDVADDGILQGHAHVFVNAQKLRRLYGNDIHIPSAALNEGVNQVAVSLNSHYHENWVSEGHEIMSSVFFDLSKEPIILHSFSSQPLLQRHIKH